MKVELFSSLLLFPNYLLAASLKGSTSLIALPTFSEWKLMKAYLKGKDFFIFSIVNLFCYGCQEGKTILPFSTKKKWQKSNHLNAMGLADKRIPSCM